MKTKYLKEQICAIIKNSLLIFLLTIICSCKNEKLKTINNEVKIIPSKKPECKITENETKYDSLNKLIKINFTRKADKIELHPIIKKGRLTWNFGKRILCNYIEKENLTSTVVYYVGNEYYREINELHFNKGSANKSFLKLKNNLIKCSNKNNLSHEEEDEFFGFMKTGVVFLLDLKSDTIIIIEYNIFTNPKNHLEITEFIASNKNNFDGILVSEGYPEIKIIK